MQTYSEEATHLLEDLRHGLLLGSEKATKNFRSLLMGEPERGRQEIVGLRKSEGMESVLAEVLTVLDIPQEEFEELQRPIRGIERPMRDVVIYLIWREGAFPLAEIGKKFHVGYTSISNARIRGEAALQNDKKLRSKLKQSKWHVLHTFCASPRR